MRASTRSIALSVLFPLLILTPVVLTQSSNVTCFNGFEWVRTVAFNSPHWTIQFTHLKMNNSKQQSPCWVAAYLLSPCVQNPSCKHIHTLWVNWTLTFVIAAFVSTLNLTQYWYLPPDVHTSTPCWCNTIWYSLIQACAVCQGYQTILYALSSFESYRLDSNSSIGGPNTHPDVTATYSLESKYHFIKP